jgi:hypothetical protein
VSEYRDLNDGDVLPSSFLDSLQEFLSGAVFNTRIHILPGTSTLRIEGWDGGQFSVAVGGKWRWRTTFQDISLTSLVKPATIYAVCSENSFSDSPAPDTDNTDYNFYIVGVSSGGSPPTGNTPAGNPIAYTRAIATIDGYGNCIPLFEREVESAFGLWRPLADRATGSLVQGTGFPTWLMREPINTARANPPGFGDLFYLDPANFPTTSRSPRIRVSAWADCNAVAPGASVNVALVAASITPGASGSGNTYGPTIPTTGPTSYVHAVNFAAVVNGLAVAPLFNDVAFPAAGLYGLVTWLSAGAVQAAGSSVHVGAQLRVRMA